MKKHHLRQDKTCLNCGSYVEKRYCPKCGQENRESRESFRHLIAEFISDFVHYDSSFWTTTRYLLFSPAKLSLEYMDGKRKSHVNPVKLYIFISFITFFLPAILPHPKKNIEPERRIEIPPGWDGYIAGYGVYTTPAKLDSIHYSTPKEERISKELFKAYKRVLQEREDSIKSLQKDSTGIIHYNFLAVQPTYIEGYGELRTKAELDSAHSLKTPHERLSRIRYIKYKYLFHIRENASDKHIREEINEFISHNLSKVLFAYMPVFAFWMWLFNLNRRKYYFDSGIFTLHLFSFWLLMITIFKIVECIFEWISPPGFVSTLFHLIFLFYFVFYFLRANRNFYMEKRWLRRVKNVFLFFVHLLFMIIIFLFYITIGFIKHY